MKIEIVEIMRHSLTNVHKRSLSQRTLTHVARPTRGSFLEGLRNFGDSYPLPEPQPEWLYLVVVRRGAQAVTSVQTNAHTQLCIYNQCQHPLHNLEFKKNGVSGLMIFTFFFLAQFIWGSGQAIREHQII